MSRKEELLEHARKRAKMSARARKFIKHYVLDPSNATRAAIRAGYSPRSARTLASRLLNDPRVQGELAKHFTDKEALIADILNQSLLRLQELLQREDVENRDIHRAIRMALEYTKIAAGVLGLNVKKQAEAQDITEELTTDELIEIHEKELERLRALKAHGSLQSHTAESQAGKTQIQ
jgi:phage terminase small subunit